MNKLNIFRLRDYFELSGWAQRNHKGPCQQKQVRQVREGNVTTEAEVR